MSQKPEMSILVKPKQGGQTTELGAAWAGKVFSGKYGNRQSYNFKPGRNVKTLKILVETTEGDKFTFTPDDAYINIMLNVPGGNDEDF